MSTITSLQPDKSAEYQNKLQTAFKERIPSVDEANTTQTGALNAGSAVKVEISALGAEELEKARRSWDNHAVSALYRTDIPISKNADGVYRIGKVDFSEVEYHAARDLVTGMTGQLKQGTLSYCDHTKMALAENLVENCASSVFSDEQSQVIVRAMRDYNDRLNSHNNELMSKSYYVESDSESAKEYWGLKQVIPEEAKDAMADLFGRKPTGTAAVTAIATNQELIDALQKKARETDVMLREGMAEFAAFYRSVMKPAYSAHYPTEMKPDTESSIEQDLYGAAGVVKMTDLAKKWLSQSL